MNLPDPPPPGESAPDVDDASGSKVSQVVAGKVVSQHDLGLDHIRDPDKKSLMEREINRSGKKDFFVVQC